MSVVLPLLNAAQRSIHVFWLISFHDVNSLIAYPGVHTDSGKRPETGFHYAVTRAIPLFGLKKARTALEIELVTPERSCNTILKGDR